MNVLIARYHLSVSLNPSREMFEGNMSFYIGSFNVKKVFVAQTKPVNNPFPVISWELYTPAVIVILLINMIRIKMAREEEDTMIKIKIKYCNICTFGLPKTYHNGPPQ